MTVLVLGVVFLAVLHLVAAVPQLKQRMKQAMGDRAYGPVFGLISLAAVAVIVLGWRLSEFVPVYEPATWGRHANYLLTFIAFLFFGVFLFRGSWRQTLRFPMGLAAAFWASGHLLANGDKASLILFGGLLIYVLLHMAIGFVAGIRPSGEVRNGHNMLSMLTGAALYGAMVQLHGAVIGVPVFDLGL